MNDKVADTASEGAAYRGPVFFAFGFRPFFLCAPIYTALAMLVWLSLYFDRLEISSRLPGFVWHAHEMLFGYSCAVIAGFLLTAVPAWTHTEPVRGRRLALLFGVWLLGRVAMWSAPVLPPALVAAADLLFLATLVVFLAPALARSERRHNLVFVPLLGLLLGADLLVHLEALGSLADTAVRGLYLAADTIALILAMIGGRVIPAFTTTALEAAGRTARIAPTPRLDSFALGALSLLIFVDLVMPNGVVMGVVSLAAAAFHFARLAHWRGLATLRRPIVWVLHLAYLWLVVALALRGLAGVTGMLGSSLALHALVIGAFGTMTMAFMTRASLGHTGRPRVAPPTAVAGYVLVTVAALLRLGLPLVDAELYDIGVALSGLAWVAGFGLVASMLWPILTRPRPDGQPG